MQKLPDTEPRDSAAFSVEQRQETPSNYCPVCSERLQPRKCKLFCPLCGYYMSCSDYY